MAAEEATRETTVAIVDDDRKFCKKDFVPDEKVMDCLFQRVLDHHPKFMPPIKEGKTNSN